MNSEKKENSEEFGKVVEALHKGRKLPSLRTYQGDIAEFIKEKDESVVSIALKEKERKEEKEEKEREKEKEDKKETQTATTPPKIKKEGLQVNLVMIILSLLLVAGGSWGLFYVFKALDEEPLNQAVFEEEIVPYNNLITITSAPGITLKTEITRLSPSGGISILKVSDTNGLPLKTIKDFFDFINITPPATLSRNLRDRYAVGVISRGGTVSPFIVISVEDFGIAFSSMLEWEKNILEDLAFLSAKTPVASTASATTTGNQNIDNRNNFVWKDIIIKNKDTRALVDNKNQSEIAYTFLDKNTILIIDNVYVIGDISSVYSSRAFTR